MEDWNDIPVSNTKAKKTGWEDIPVYQPGVPTVENENANRAAAINTRKGWFALKNKPDSEIAATLGLDYEKIKKGLGYKEGMLQGMIETPDAWTAKWKQSIPGRIVEGGRQLGGSVLGALRDVFGAMGSTTDRNNAELQQAYNQILKLNYAHLNPDAGVELPILGRVDVPRLGAELAAGAATGPTKLPAFALNKQAAFEAAKALAKAGGKGAFLSAIAPNPEGATPVERLGSRAASAGIGAVFAPASQVLMEKGPAIVSQTVSKIRNAAQGNFKPGLIPDIIKKGFTGPEAYALKAGEEAALPGYSLASTPGVAINEAAKEAADEIGRQYQNVYSKVGNVPFGPLLEDYGKQLAELKKLPNSNKAVIESLEGRLSDIKKNLVANPDAVGYSKMLPKTVEGVERSYSPELMLQMGEASIPFETAHTLARDIGDEIRQAQKGLAVGTTAERDLNKLRTEHSNIRKALFDTADSYGVGDELRQADKAWASEVAQPRSGWLGRITDTERRNPDEFYSTAIKGKSKETVNEAIANMPKHGRAALAELDFQDKLGKVNPLRPEDTDWTQKLADLRENTGMRTALDPDDMAERKAREKTVEFLAKVQHKTRLGTTGIGVDAPVMRFITHAAINSWAGSTPAIKFYAALSKMPPGSSATVDFIKKNMQTKWGQSIMKAALVAEQQAGVHRPEMPKEIHE